MKAAIFILIGAVLILLMLFSLAAVSIDDADSLRVLLGGEPMIR